MTDPLHELRTTVDSQPLGLALTTIVYELRKHTTAIYQNITVIRQERTEEDYFLESITSEVESLRQVIDQLLVKSLVPRIEALSKEE